MSNVKTITFGNKNVRLIENEYGEAIWRENIFKGYGDSWCYNESVALANGLPASTGGNRYTFVFSCKPGTRYSIKVLGRGERLAIYTNAKVQGNTAPSTLSDALEFSTYGATVVCSYQDTVSDRVYSFVTDSNAHTCWVYFSLNTKPDGMIIER